MVRNFVHVEDLAKIIAVLVKHVLVSKIPVYKKWTRVLNVGNPNQNLSLFHFYKLAREKFHTSSPLVGGRTFEKNSLVARPHRVSFDLSNMENLIGKMDYRSI
jgi:nucleoside-diphosphate-sugar epimerase